MKYTLLIILHIFISCENIPETNEADSSKNELVVQAIIANDELNIVRFNFSDFSDKPEIDSVFIHQNEKRFVFTYDTIVKVFNRDGSYYDNDKDYQYFTKLTVNGSVEYYQMLYKTDSISFIPNTSYKLEIVTTAGNHFYAESRFPEKIDIIDFNIQKDASSAWIKVHFPKGEHHFRFKFFGYSTYYPPYYDGHYKGVEWVYKDSERDDYYSVNLSAAKDSVFYFEIDDFFYDHFERIDDKQIAHVESFSPEFARTVERVNKRAKKFFIFELFFGSEQDEYEEIGNVEEALGVFTIVNRNTAIKAF